MFFYINFIHNFNKSQSENQSQNFDYIGLKELAEIYFNLKVEFIFKTPVGNSTINNLYINNPDNSILNLITYEKELCLHDVDKNIIFPLKVKSKKIIEVFSILDVLTEYVSKYYSVIALIDNEIYEKGNSGFILGRACGDRVAAVTTKSNSFREISLTFLHETMHTMGLDHCMLWKCVMNSNGIPDPNEDEGGRMELCPLELIKLKECIGFDVIARYKKLSKFYERYKWVKSQKLVDDIILNIEY